MTTMAATGILVKERLDLGAVVKHGWRLFVKDVVALLIGGLVAVALSIVTLGVLAGPLFAGLHKMVAARVRYGTKPAWDDIFDGLDRFWTYLGAALFLVVTIGVASITIVGGILLGTIWLYAFPIMVDRGVGFFSALGASYELVRATGFLEHLVLVLLLAVAGSIGGPAFIVTTPLTVVVVMAAYFIAEGSAAAVEAA